MTIGSLTDVNAGSAAYTTRKLLHRNAAIHQLKIHFMKKLFLALSLLIPAALAGGNAAASTNAVAGDANVNSTNPIIARGKGFEITRQALDQVLANARVKNPGEELPPESQVYALNQLIEIQLVMQKATAAEKAQGWQEIDANFTNIIKTMGREKFERQLKATSMTPDDLRLMLFNEETAQTSLTRQLGINVTDADAKKYFDDNPGAFDEPEKARVRELLLLTTSDFTTSAAPPLPAAVVAAKHRQIFELHKRAVAGEDLAALATQYNEDPITKENGGELTFKQDQMEFGDLAFSLKPNQISEVVTNDEGFRFFQLLEIIPAKKTEFTAFADKLKKMLAGSEKRGRAPAYIKQLRKEASVEILDPKLKALVEANEAAARAAEKQRAEFLSRQAAEATNAPANP